MPFKRATKTQARLRLALDGPSGSGKTFTALTFAFALAGGEGRVAVIDTERGSASKYADRFPAFDVLELTTFSPQLYTQAVGEAAQAGYDVLVIDSLSHAWEGVGGALEMVDKAAARQRDNSYTAWKDVTPVHRTMIDAILQSPCHVIVTMRSKMEYILESDRNGKMVPKKVGMAPIQRQGTEYEFDIVCDLDIQHKLIVSKTRCPAVDEADMLKPTAAWMQPVIAWLSDGQPPAKATAFVPQPAPAMEQASAPASPTQNTDSSAAQDAPSLEQVVADAEKREDRRRSADEAAAAASARTGVAVVRGDGSDYKTSDRPWTARQVIAAIHDAAAHVGPNKKANGLFGATIDILEQIGVNERKAFIEAVFAVKSSKELSEAQKIALARWCKPVKDPPSADNPHPKWYSSNPHLAAELDAVTAWLAFEL